MSEGELGPRQWWYIPKRGIHHHSKLHGKGLPRPHSAGGKRRQHRLARPSRRVNCGNDEGGQPEWDRRPGADCGSRITTLNHQASTATASRRCPAVPAPQAAASQTGPDDLAAELNPHETELNPHETVPAASRQSRSEAGLSAHGAIARRHSNW